MKKNKFLCIHEKIYNRNQYYRKIINKFYYLIPDVIFQKKFTKTVFKIINMKKYDILFPNNGIWGAKYSAKYKKNKSTPFICTGHGGIGLGEKYVIKTRPDMYICLTDNHLSWARDINKFEQTRTIVIPNGVNVSDFTQSKNKKGTKILSVAALTAFKRHELTIKAVSRIEDVELIILGKGEEESNLKRLATRLLPGRCTITSTSYEDIKTYYSEADLFVLPSLNEPFGIVYLEAMASNLPIVAPDDSQRKEIIGNAGLYCDVEDSDTYAQCIKKALNMEWGNKSRTRAEQFDWTIVAKKYEDVIEEIISKYD